MGNLEGRRRIGTEVKELPFRPIILKELSLACDIRQAELGKVTGASRPSINTVFNKGYVPKQILNFKEKVESFLRGTPSTMQWLFDRGLEIKNVWDPAGQDLRNRAPKGHGYRSHIPRQSALIPADPEQLIVKWEVKMLSQEVLRHFKLFRNPFIDDIQKESDVFLSDEQRYIKATMIDAARHGGFLAVIGEVGSGKSVIRRMVIEQLKRDGDVLVIYPQIIDKGRLNAGAICDAIVMDISSEKPKGRLEQKTRQVQSLLLDRSKSNYRSCLVIEEAHDLSTHTLKYLKRFYELEDGYRKLLGIILIGQTELKHMFNEAQHVDMREVIRRVQIAEIRGLDGNLQAYLSLKFKRIGAKVEDIFAPDAFAALESRMMSEDRQGKKISYAYPLLVNNYAAKAMNLAFEMGELKVTEEIVLAI